MCLYVYNISCMPHMARYYYYYKLKYLYNVNFFELKIKNENYFFLFQEKNIIYLKFFINSKTNIKYIVIVWWLI